GRLIVAALLLAGATLVAQEQFIDVNRVIKDVGTNGPIRTVHISGGVYALIGGGANIVVSVGDEGVLVVDTGAAAQFDNILPAISSGRTPIPSSTSRMAGRPEGTSTG